MIRGNLTDKRLREIRHAIEDSVYTFEIRLCVQELFDGILWLTMQRDMLVASKQAEHERRVAGGKKGNARKMLSTTQERRHEIAQNAALARWRKREAIAHPDAS